MEYFPAPLEALVEQFARLPGIGGKTAQRLAFHNLSLPEEDAQAFADAIVTIVMVTHDLKAALKSARTVLHIGRKGLFTGTASDYLASPQGRRFREELES